MCAVACRHPARRRRGGASARRRAAGPGRPPRLKAAPRGEAAERGVRYSSEQFARQAGSDLGQAQAIARESESGDALGTAMFLAQQSIEKRFKSIFLQVCECMAVDPGDGFFRDTLGHVVHLHPAEFYKMALKGIGYPFGEEPVKFVRTRIGQLEQAGKIWNPKFYNFQIRALLFQYFLEAPMPEDGYRALDTHLASIFSIINGMDGSDESPRHPFCPLSSPGCMDSIVSDRQRLQECRDCFAAMDPPACARLELEQVFGRRLDVISGIVDRHRMLPKSTSKSHALLAILDYGAVAASLLSPSYVYLVPHAVMGRYPTRLPTGELTTDIYASQRNAILARLFVTVQYDYDQLCGAGERVGELCEVCQKGTSGA